jgi:hypothetical protein
MRTSSKSFLVQQFFKNAAKFRGEQPLLSSAGDETPRAVLSAHGKVDEKSDSFSGEGEQDRPLLITRTN